jgi:isochorismate hydrolase
MKTQIAAEPQPITVDLNRTALVIIDMQRDFLEPGGLRRNSRQ